MCEVQCYVQARDTALRMGGLSDLYSNTVRMGMGIGHTCMPTFASVSVLCSPRIQVLVAQPGINVNAMAMAGLHGEVALRNTPITGDYLTACALLSLACLLAWPNATRV